MWRRKFSAVGSSHGLDNLCDEQFVPIGTDNIDLFTTQHKFLFAVLCTKLKTSKGKELIRQYSKTRDAQAILRDLDEYHTKSTKAGINSGELLKYITTARLGPSSKWNGNTKDFIIYWVNQGRLRKANLSPTALGFDD